MNKIDGYVAAPFTPLLENRELNLEVIPDYAAFLIRNGLDGVFVSGSTGEGALLSREERMALSEKWLDASVGKLKVVVHTGGCNLKDQQELASHAEKIGAWAVAAMAPAFLPPKRNEELLEYCQTIAEAAPSLPFYYYHIPGLNGVHLPVTDLLRSAVDQIPNFGGVKYTHSNIYEFEQCRHIADREYEMLWGLDEMFLDGLVYGNRSGVGGTYNHCFSLYSDMGQAYEEKDMKKCRELQHKSHLFVDVLIRYRGNLMGGKRMMKFMGMDCGPNRLPLQDISDHEEAAMRKELEAIGFFSYCNK
jgi:N-acetylneuraminate lyase